MLKRGCLYEKQYNESSKCIYVALDESEITVKNNWEITRKGFAFGLCRRCCESLLRFEKTETGNRRQGNLGVASEESECTINHRPSLRSKRCVSEWLVVCFTLLCLALTSVLTDGPHTRLGCVR